MSLFKKEHIFVNISTLSTEYNAGIRNISAIRFTLEHGMLDDFTVNVNPVSCKKAGLHIDKGTLEWWMEQPREINDFLAVDQVDIKVALTKFNDWCGDSKNTYFWAMGTQFHLGILNAVYGILGIEHPWMHWKVLDAVTMHALLDFEEAKVEMNPLDKANHSVSQIVRLMNEE